MSSQILPTEILAIIFGYAGGIQDIYIIAKLNHHWQHKTKNVLECVRRQRWLSFVLDACLKDKSWLDLNWNKQFSWKPDIYALASSAKHIDHQGNCYGFKGNYLYKNQKSIAYISPILHSCLVSVDKVTGDVVVVMSGPYSLKSTLYRITPETGLVRTKALPDGCISFCVHGNLIYAIVASLFYSVEFVKMDLSVSELVVSRKPLRMNEYSLKFLGVRNDGSRVYIWRKNKMGAEKGNSFMTLDTTGHVLDCWNPEDKIECATVTDKGFWYTYTQPPGFQLAFRPFTANRRQPESTQLLSSTPAEEKVVSLTITDHNVMIQTQEGNEDFTIYKCDLV